MSPIAILKLLKAAKSIRDYVVKENDLDQQMDSARSRLDKLEKDSHPPRTYVVCDKCNYKIKNYEGTD